MVTKPPNINGNGVVNRGIGTSIFLRRTLHDKPNDIRGMFHNA